MSGADVPSVFVNHETDIDKRIVKLVCIIRLHEKSPEVSRVVWTKDCREIDILGSGGKYNGGSIADPSLTINEVDSNDEGKYQCCASNSAGEMWSEIILLGPPTIELGNPKLDDLNPRTVTYIASIKSIPLAMKAEWKVKEGPTGNYKTIAISDPLYRGSTVSMPYPKLIHNEYRTEHPESYQLEVFNFIGSSRQNTEDVTVVSNSRSNIKQVQGNMPPKRKVRAQGGNFTPKMMSKMAAMPTHNLNTDGDVRAVVLPQNRNRPETQTQPVQPPAVRSTFCPQGFPVGVSSLAQGTSAGTWRGGQMESPEAVSSPLVESLRDDSQLTATIRAKYNRLYGVCCVSEEQFWTCGDNGTMKLFNVQGKLLSSIRTKTGQKPGGIAVTPEGDLVYTEVIDGTINLVKNKETHTLITLQGEFRPLQICCTASGDLLVVLYTIEESKIVRYSGSTETQTIQFDDQGRPLYSSFIGYKYVCENRNLDICVGDCDALAVVVVNQSGQLRFRYTGHPVHNLSLRFIPYGVTTDSQSCILIADLNGRIHILDQDGQFLRYIHNLDRPHGLCVDSRDNLFVAEEKSAKVKTIQYL